MPPSRGALPVLLVLLALPCRAVLLSEATEASATGAGRQHGWRTGAPTEVSRADELTDVVQDLEADRARENEELAATEAQLAQITQRRNAEHAAVQRTVREIAFVHGDLARAGGSLRGAAAAATAVAAPAVDERAATEPAAAVPAARAVEAAAPATDAPTMVDPPSADAPAEALPVKSSVAEHKAAAPVVAAIAAPLVAAAPATSARLPATAAATRPAEEAQLDSADSADDSFKELMKDEDGEDELGDPSYEDSANALAGAIGWNRNKIEHDADNGIKQLTEAIGGKQVVHAVQGMMMGVR